VEPGLSITISKYVEKGGGKVHVLGEASGVERLSSVGWKKFNSGNSLPCFLG
jgi:hypothetical protein